MDIETLIAELATMPPDAALAAAILINHRPAIAYGESLDKIRNVYSGLGLSKTSCAIITAAAVGHALGDNINLDNAKASQAAEGLLEACIKVMRYAAEAGYADNLKEKKSAGS